MTPPSRVSFMTLVSVASKVDEYGDLTISVATIGTSFMRVIGRWVASRAPLVAHTIDVIFT
jgi:hypothetical protein